MTDTHNKKKTNTDFFINFIKKELLESDFKDQLQLQLLYIIIPIIIVTIISYVLHFIIHLNMEYGILRFFVVSFSGLIFSLFSIYFLGISKGEKTMVKSWVNRKIS